MVSESFHEAAVLVQIWEHSSGVGWVRYRAGESELGSRLADPMMTRNGNARLEE